MTSPTPDPIHGAVASDVSRPRAGGDEGIGCGEFLSRARRARGLTLQQIAETTKIPLRHLEALERDEFAALPGGMYRRAFVRAYAYAVGLDPGVALARFNRALHEAMSPVADVAHVPAAPPAVAGRSRIVIAGGVAVVTAAIALAIWARQSVADHITSSAAPVTRPASDLVPVQHVAGDVAVGSSGSSVEPASAPRKQRTEPEPAVAPPATAAQPPAASDGTTAVAVTTESQLTIITEPAGARVTVNGVGWGATPVTIRYLPPGPKRVRVTMAGYRAEERFIELEPRTTTLHVPMQNED